MSKTFDKTRPCLVLAPHLEYPLRRGDDIMMDRKWACYSNYVPYVDIIGRHVVTRYENGKAVSTTKYNNTNRSKVHASLLTILKRSHYLREKLLTPGFIKTSHGYLLDPAYGLVVFSYIPTSSILELFSDLPARQYLIDSQHDDFKSLGNAKHSSSNPLVKLVLHYSLNWLEHYMANKHDKFHFIHVSEDDYQGYLSRFPDHSGEVVPVGVDIPGFQENIKTDDTIRLIFVGALSIQINVDAIRYFRDKYYPLLKQSFGGKLAIIIAGSNPTHEVVEICKRQGWQLHKDIPDSQLHALYLQSTFALLPFPRSTGSKLKLLNCLAHGIPFLATQCVQQKNITYLSPCLFSDDPAAWVSQVRSVLEQPVSSSRRTELVSFAAEYSWENIAAKLYKSLATHL